MNKPTKREIAAALRECTFSEWGKVKKCPLCKLFNVKAFGREACFRCYKEALQEIDNYTIHYNHRAYCQNIMLNNCSIDFGSMMGVDWFQVLELIANGRLSNLLITNRLAANRALLATAERLEGEADEQDV